MVEEKINTTKIERLLSMESGVNGQLAQNPVRRNVTGTLRTLSFVNNNKLIF